jgi:hypothetical protein
VNKYFELDAFARFFAQSGLQGPFPCNVCRIRNQRRVGVATCIFLGTDAPYTLGDLVEASLAPAAAGAGAGAGAGASSAITASDGSGEGGRSRLTRTKRHLSLPDRLRADEVFCEVIETGRLKENSYPLSDLQFFQSEAEVHAFLLEELERSRQAIAAAAPAGAGGAGGESDVDRDMQLCNALVRYDEVSQLLSSANISLATNRCVI